MKNFSELVCEYDNENLNKGRLVKLDYNITKQKFKENDNTYVLFNCKSLVTHNLAADEYLIMQLASTIIKFLDNAKSVLVVGLGNRHISSDSLGTETLKHIIATRGIAKSKCVVSAISTSVFGLTGIESADIIKSVCGIVKPDVVILIDSLCANSYENLVTNFQISNVGFSVGAGVNNHRKVIDEYNLNVPVISIGVPLVVYAKSFISSSISTTMQSVMQTDKKSLYKDVFDSLLNINFDNLVLTTKDCDISVKKLGYIIGSAINNACNGYSLNEQKVILGY